MAKTTWKFQLETTDMQVVEMPADAEILCIQAQFEAPCIWALVSPDAPKAPFVFEIFGTGHPVPEDGNREYIGTYQLSGGALVFHCFRLFSLGN